MKWMMVMEMPCPWPLILSLTRCSSSFFSPLEMYIVHPPCSGKKKPSKTTKSKGTPTSASNKKKSSMVADNTATPSPEQADYQQAASTTTIADQPGFGSMMPVDSQQFPQVHMTYFQGTGRARH